MVLGKHIKNIKQSALHFSYCDVLSGSVVWTTNYFSNEIFNGANRAWLLCDMVMQYVGINQFSSKNIKGEQFLFCK